jgi:ABC-2 type transport system permease protein
MTTAIEHSYFMAMRALRALLRQPAYVLVTLVQPVIWLLLFGALFKRVVDIPGFGTRSYITFLTPGVVVMTALFSCGWSGMAFIEDIDRGVLDRFLVSPVRRGGLMAGSLAYGAVTTIVQSLIIVVLGVVAGARFGGGGAGLAVLVACAVLLGGAVSSLSNALGLLARQRETLIGATQFVMLPLTFLSSAMMQPFLMPAWIRDVTRYNPLNWAVEASREALGAGADWGFVGPRLAGLLALAVACGWLATRAFRAYQRSV